MEPTDEVQNDAGANFAMDEGSLQLAEEQMAFEELVWQCHYRLWRKSK
jgi:hypothetical protein